MSRKNRRFSVHPPKGWTRSDRGLFQAAEYGLRVHVFGDERDPVVRVGGGILPVVVLVAAACEWAGEDAAIWELAASGFRDTTRLAASDTTMMLDILYTNRIAIGARLRDYARSLTLLSEMVMRGDEAELRAWMDRAAGARRALGGGKSLG